MSDGALRTVIAEYTRESGVRSLERALGTLCRKGARKYAQYGRIGGVTRRNLARYLGPAQFPGSQLEENDRVGLAVGLAYTALGGETLMIEVSALPGKGELILTGTLGEVMRESAQAGLSYIRARSRRLGLPGDFYERFDLHIHVPQGGIPKDGPSAGITIATAVASALSKRPVRKNVAMTGEITLRGRVLAVGGLRRRSWPPKGPG